MSKKMRQFVLNLKMGRVKKAAHQMFNQDEINYNETYV